MQESTLLSLRYSSAMPEPHFFRRDENMKWYYMTRIVVQWNLISFVVVRI